MRAFSTLEILLSLAIGVTSIVGVLLITFGTPDMLANARREYRAYDIASALITKAERNGFGALSSVATSTTNGYESSLEFDFLHEDLAARITARVRFTKARGKKKEVVLESILTDPAAAKNDVCSPFLLGTSGSVQARYLIQGLPPISDIALTRDTLLVSVSSTSSPTDPTLFMYDLDGSLLLRGSYDNASTSRVGYASVATAAPYAYAANGFGSASAATCSTGACAQLHIFENTELVATLSLPAKSSGNRSTPAKTVTYHKEYVYLGLEKTLSGNEFNIIDVHDPDGPRLVGGVSIRRSVNDIHIQGDRAYLATSDPEREFVIVDTEDPSAPRIVDEWDAPGSTNFGLGNVVLSRAGRIYAGRTYVGNAPELYVFEGTFRNLVYEHDLGTVAVPKSVNGIVVRDTFLAVLSGNQLQFWSREDRVFRHAGVIELPGIGTTLACRGNTYYVGGVTDAGEGFVMVI